MSTKIYNGFEIKGVSTLKEIVDFSQKFQKKVAVARTQALSKMIANIMVQELDLRTLGISTKPKTESAYGIASTNITSRIDKLIANKYDRDPFVDFECSIVFFPLKDRLLAMFFGEHPEVQKLWAKQKGVSEYHYQNQSDSPDDISPKAWKQRGKDWDQVLFKGNGIPSKSGVTAEISENSYFYRDKIEDFLMLIPSFDTRVDQAALSLLESKKAHLYDNNKSTWENYDLHRTWLKSEQGKAELLATKAHVRTLLIENPIKEDVLARTED